MTIRISTEDDEIFNQVVEELTDKIISAISLGCSSLEFALDLKKPEANKKSINLALTTLINATANICMSISENNTKSGDLLDKLSMAKDVIDDFKDGLDQWVLSYTKVKLLN